LPISTLLERAARPSGLPCTCIVWHPDGKASRQRRQRSGACVAYGP
jgi:hypothetical protein